MKNKKNMISEAVAAFLMVFLVALVISTPAGAYPSETEKVGVLVVAHGSTSEDWCAPIRAAVEEANLPYPIELGFLEMVPGGSIPDAVDKLDAEGVTKIIAVPLFVSSNSGHIAEIEYILGLRDKAPEDDLAQVDTDAEIVLSDAMNDHAFIAEILADRAAGLVEDASNETVVFVLHGTADEQFEGWNQSANSLANKVKLMLRHSRGIDIEDVRCSFVNVDPSDPDSTSMGVRAVVEDVSATSRPIVVPLFISEGYFTGRKIPKLLDGLDYAYAAKGGRALTPHSNLADWIEVSVASELPLPEIPVYDGEELLNISFDELHQCLCGMCAYRSTLEAFSNEQVWDGVPHRGDVRIISGHPSDGHEETFLYVLDNSTGDYVVNAPEGTNRTYTGPENYVYTFIRKSTGDSFTLAVKDEVFPERMYELRTKCKLKTATLEETKAFFLLKEAMAVRMLYSPSDEVFEGNMKFSKGAAILPGWNFISVPFELNNSNIDDVLKGVNYDVLLYYNTSKSIWEQSGVDFTDFEPLKGYWIRSSAGYTQFIGEDVLEKEVPVVPPSMTVYEGWNSIGYTDSEDSLPARLALASISDSYTVIEGPYNPVTMSYEKVGHNGNTGVISGRHVGTDIFDMGPYEAFWVLVTGETTLSGF